MPAGEIERAALAAIRIFLAAALFAGIIAAFAAQSRARREALRIFRKTRPSGDGDAFFVRYASARNLADPTKAFAGEAFGVLTVTRRAVVFRAEPRAAPAWSLEFLPGRARAEWIGRRMRNGAFSWFAIAAGGERHFFTSAERLGVVGSKRRTRRICDAVLARLA